MTTNECVTLFHYDEDSETFSRHVFPHASVYRKTVAAACENGLVMDSVIQIRIPVACGEQIREENEIAHQERANETETNAHHERANQADDAVINVGDYVFIGVSEDSKPDRGLCHKVLGFSQNMRGANPHIRIEAK